MLRKFHGVTLSLLLYNTPAGWNSWYIEKPSMRAFSPIIEWDDILTVYGGRIFEEHSCMFLCKSLCFIANGGHDLHQLFLLHPRPLRFFHALLEDLYANPLVAGLHRLLGESFCDCLLAVSFFEGG